MTNWCQCSPAPVTKVLRQVNLATIRQHEVTLIWCAGWLVNRAKCLFYRICHFESAEVAFGRNVRFYCQSLSDVPSSKGQGLDLHTPIIRAITNSGLLFTEC